MRIAHLIRGYAPADSLGGPVQSTRLLCEGLAREGCDVTVVTTTEGQATDSPVRKSKGWQSWNGVKVCYCPQRFGLGLAPGFVAKAREAILDSDIVHVTGTFSFEALIGLTLPVVLRKPYVVSPRGTLQPWGMSVKRWKKRPALALIRPLLQRANVLHATSELEAASLRTMGLNAFIATVPNPVQLLSVSDGCPEKWREKLAIAPDAPVLLVLGRIHPVKGIDIAIEALRKIRGPLPNAVLVVAGPDEGDHARMLVAVAKKLGVESGIRWVPMVAGQEKASLLREADLLLLPSRQENFGNVVAEALSVGTPVVASCATPWTSLEEAGCGRWVSANGSAFASAVVEMLTDPQRLEAAGANAQVQAAGFAPSVIVRRMLNLYDACLSGGTTLEKAGTVP